MSYINLIYTIYIYIYTYMYFMYVRQMSKRPLNMFSSLPRIICIIRIYVCYIQIYLYVIYLYKYIRNCFYIQKPPRPIIYCI